MRFSFIVGVSSSPPGSQSSASTVNFLIASTFETWLLTSSTAVLDLREQRSSRGERLERRVLDPLLGRPGGRDVGVEHDQRASGTAAGRRSRTAVPTSGCALSFASRFAGEMFLPPAVMISSFLRSTILQVALVVELADVAGVEPAVGVDRLGGLLGHVPVALHDLRAADQDLAVLGELQLHARA